MSAVSIKKQLTFLVTLEQHGAPPRCVDCGFVLRRELHTTLGETKHARQMVRQIRAKCNSTA